MRSRRTDALLLGPWRRRRAMERRLRELDHLDGTRRRRPGSLGRIVAIAGASATVLVGVVLYLHQVAGFDVSFAGISRPTALGTPLPAPPGKGGYAFEQHQPGDPGSPAAYSPCKAIHVVVNTDQEPARAGGLVENALREVGRITGLKFVVDGSTTEEPTNSSARRSGQPVLIAWTDPSRITRLSGAVAGLGGSTPAVDPLSGREYLVSGQVSLDAPQFSELLQRPDGRPVARAIILHELGHLVGLAHVDDPTQLMYHENVGVLDFQAGDRRGLEKLGRGACIG